PFRMSPPDLDKLRLSGRISSVTREDCRKMIRVGARIEDIARAAEAMILELGGKPAFAEQFSRNDNAAHYCSPPGDQTRIEAGDMVELYLCTQVDGYVTDSAVTVDLAAGEQSALVAASQTALENAIALMGPGASITEIGGRGAGPSEAFGLHPGGQPTRHGPAPPATRRQPTRPSRPRPRAAPLRAQ